MAFTPPTFNLAINIWRFPNLVYGAPDVITVCNLAYGRRNAQSLDTTDLTMSVLLPAGTDIRADWNTAGRDVVEVPAGSKRFYEVANVDDSGKGFTNEHRVALVSTLPSGYFGFVFPVPLP